MKSFIDSIAPFAIKHGRANNISVALLTSQACLESSYGRSELAVKANNLFGIKKGSNWNGETYTVVTPEQKNDGTVFYIEAEFRKFANYEECIKSLIDKYLNGTGWEKHNRYEAVIGEKDYKKATQALLNSGYATDKKYNIKLNSIIEKYNLTKYDKEETQMVKIVIDAGHGFGTGGKRSPNDEREWSFNNKVALAAIAKLNKYQNVQILRTDDPTGKTDVPLATRTNKANAFNADVLVSIHHNALAGKWHSGGGVETYVQEKTASKASKDIAALIHPLIVKSMGLKDRGLKTANFHMTREVNCPAILTEGGFFDSTVDIIPMRSDARLIAQGEAIADGLIAYFKLKPKSGVVVSTPVPKPAAPTNPQKGDDDVKFSSPTLQKETETSIASKAHRDIIVKAAVNAGAHVSWLDKLKNNTLTDGDVFGLAVKYVVDTNK